MSQYTFDNTKERKTMTGRRTPNKKTTLSKSNRINIKFLKMVNTLTCRPFFVSSTATSPRNVVVVLETSASMTGDKLHEAKHAVLQEMDTLGLNDRVNIFFSFFSGVKNISSLCSEIAHFVHVADCDKKSWHK